MIKVAFVGAGRMAEAMVRGILAKGTYRPEELGCLSGSGETAGKLARATGIHHEPNLQVLVTEAEITVLACKPFQVQSLDPQLAEWTAGKCVVSVLAGIPLHHLFHRFPMVENIIRAMPNTPSSIGEGMTGYACLKAPEGKAEKAVHTILEAIGPAIQVKEPLIDAVTGVSGSGVAFVYHFVKGLRDAAAIHGIPREQAHTFAVQTLLGAARLLQDTGKSPEDLIAQVVSKGGTTEAGLAHLNAEGFEDIIHGAVAAATQRSRELSDHHQ
jgi:pyrroline-5-carboxylate reductase